MMRDYPPEAIDAILRSLGYLHDNFYTPGAIDRAQLFATQKEVGDVIAMLQARREDACGRYQLTPEQQDLLAHLIGYTAMILPASMASDAELLSDLFDSFGDEDE